jgi:hypothetical protein
MDAIVLLLIDNFPYMDDIVLLLIDNFPYMDAIILLLIDNFPYMDDIVLLLIDKQTYCLKLFYFLCVYIFCIDEDISRFNYKYNKLLFYLHVPTTIFHKSTTQLKHVFV